MDFVNQKKCHFSVIIYIFFSLLVFTSTEHPVSFIVMLLILSLMSMCLMTFFMKNSWFCMIFILLMMGGLLVLFMYMASLASNEPFKLPAYFNFIIFIIFIMLLIYQINKILLNFNTMNSMSLNNLSSSNIFWNYIMAMLYLFYVMIFTIEFTTPMKMPLRTKF